MDSGTLKPLVWIGSSYHDLLALPREVRRSIGFVLYFAQEGGRHQSTKVLKGFGGSAVLEVIENGVGGTYRAVYTVKFAGVVYALHVFQKKSTKGIATPQHEIELIKKRLQMAYLHYQEHRHEY
jgi:phage-related protein